MRYWIVAFALALSFTMMAGASHAAPLSHAPIVLAQSSNYGDPPPVNSNDNMSSNDHSNQVTYANGWDDPNINPGVQDTSSHRVAQWLIPTVVVAAIIALLWGLTARTDEYATAPHP